MKKIFTYLALASALAFGLNACTEEAPEYEPGSPDLAGCYGVYFPEQDAAGDHTFDPTQDPTINFTIARTNTKGAIKVPLKVTASAENVFEVAEANFADGEAETSITVNFPNAEMGTKYTLLLEVEDDPQYISMYLNEKPYIDFSILRVQWMYVKNEAGEDAEFTFVQGWWGEERTGKVRYYEVNGIRTCETVTDPTEPYYYGDDDPNQYLSFWGGDHFKTLKDTDELHFTWYVNETNSKGDQLVELPPSAVYVNSNYEATVWAYDPYWFFKSNGTSVDDMTWLQFAKKYGDPDDSYPVGYYKDGEFYFNVHRYYMADIGGWNPGLYDLVLTGDGFTRVDYTLELEADYPSNGSVPIYVTAGKDVKTVKYAVYEGSLKAAEIETAATALGEDPNAVSFTDLAYDAEDKLAYGLMEVSLDNSGHYTLVAIVLDENNDIKGEAASIEFDFIGVDDEADNAVDVQVATEPIAQRYLDLGYDAIHSAAYYITGSELTEVHVGVVENAKYQTNIDAYNNTVKNAASLALSEADLARANSFDAYATIITNLSASTEYAIIVWATNGKLDKVVYTTFTTEEDPETWHSYGTVTWTDAFFGPWFGNDALTYNVPVEESDKTAGRLRFVNLYGEAFPYNEPGDWDTSKDYYLYIYINDPDFVWFENFDTGCNWGYGDFLLACQPGRYIPDNGLDVVKGSNLAAYFGKLENNVITFPAGSILKGMANYNNGAWYFGNQNDPYTITLNPGASLPTAAPAHKHSVHHIGNSSKADGAYQQFRYVAIEHQRKAVEVRMNTFAGVRLEKKAASHLNLSL